MFDTISKFEDNNAINNNTLINVTCSKSYTFPQWHDIIITKTYIPYVGCVLEHLINNHKLSNRHKLFFLLVNGFGMINLNQNYNRTSALPAKSWAKMLGCSKAQIFKMQKQLEKTDYFIIEKSKNNAGQYNRNLITATLPDNVFNDLSKEPNKKGKLLPYLPLTESKMDYLDRTKLFIPINYYLLNVINTSIKLTPTCKILALDFFANSYKTSFNKIDKSNFFYTTSYAELCKRHNISPSALTKAVSLLEKHGFIVRQRFFVKQSNLLKDRKDKSLWRIYPTIPKELMSEFEALPNRAGLTELTENNVEKGHLQEEKQIFFKDQTVSKDINNSRIDKKIKKNNFFNGKYNQIYDSYFNTNNIDKHILKKNSIQLLENNKNLIITKLLSYISQSDHSLDQFCQYINKDLNNKKDIDILDGEMEKINSVDVKEKEEEKKKKEKSKLSKFLNLKKNKSVNLSRAPKILKSSDSNKANEQIKTLEQFKSGPRLLIADIGLFSEYEAKELQIKSGRKYSPNFMNQLLLKLKKVKPNHYFANRFVFMKYFTKVLEYEKRDIIQTDNKFFRLKCNIEEGSEGYMELKEEKAIEKYLEEVENSHDRTKYGQLRKKIAGQMESRAAYELLRSISYCDQEGEQIRIKLRKKVEGLDNNLKSRLLKMVQAIYDTSWEKIERVEIEVEYREENRNCQDNGNNNTNSKHYEPNIDESTNWGKVRKGLIERFGINIDKYWFSKLVATEDKEQRKLQLKAPSEFAKYWINSNYFHHIETICLRENTTIKEVNLIV